MQNLGQLSGKMIIFGGVYSNLQALNELYIIAQEKGIPAENIICTGDVVGYCAQPEECVQKIREWGIHVISGNVERQLSEGGLDCGCSFSAGSRCDNFAKNWYPFTQVNISEESLQWMRNLPENIRFKYGNKDIAIVHGGLDKVSQFIFKSTPWAVKERIIHQAQADIIIGGHCGLPFFDERENKYWINAGVIGMPANDGTNRVWYLELDENEKKGSFSFCSFNFNGNYTHDRMMRKGLPDEYAETLLSGLWDNNEILPQWETSQQGIAIALDKEGALPFRY